jgi:hypothetical protein
MLMFSVVPRVTDAQPPTRAHSAKIPRLRILSPQPDAIEAQPESEGK